MPSTPLDKAMILLHHSDKREHHEGCRDCGEVTPNWTISRSLQEAKPALVHSRILNFNPIVGGFSGGERDVLEGTLQIPGEIFTPLERAEPCDRAAAGLPGEIESCDEDPAIVIPLK